MRYESLYRFNNRSEWLRIGGTNDIFQAYSWLDEANEEWSIAYHAEDVVLLDTSNNKCLWSRAEDEDLWLKGWEEFATHGGIGDQYEIRTS